MKILAIAAVVLLTSTLPAFAQTCPPGCTATTPPTEPPPSGGSWWKPTGAALEFQWFLSAPLKLSNEKHMGTGKTAFNGTRPPATDPKVYDLDGFENPKSTVKDLHDRGFKVVCYIEVGGAENYRDDYDQFPPETLGRNMAGWPGEKWIDIRHPEVVRIIKDRIKMCADKGYDAIEPDLDTSYVEPTGFDLTKADEISYMKDLANYAHSLGIAMWGKNPDSTGDSFSSDMVDVFDAVLTEECGQYNTCGLLKPFTQAGKLVFEAEYAIGTDRFCPNANDKTGWMGTRFSVDLNGSKREPCR
jgi:hypothetical protein